MFTPGTVVHGELLGGHEARPLLVLRPDSRDGASLHPPPPYPSPYRFPYCTVAALVGRAAWTPWNQNCQRAGCGAAASKTKRRTQENRE